ncbi:MAG: hypothetical protein M3O09_00595 [Acidobacteriota bacterium]|nr:hypothetical protein [Acidobacteriota bacterium]
MRTADVEMVLLGDRKPNWWTLIFYCGASTLAAALGLALLFAGATAVFASGQSSKDQRNSAQQIFHGVVTDDHCGARHTDKEKNPSDCTRICVRNGSKYALVDGDKIFKLEGNDADLARLAGQRADFEGTLRNDTIKISKVIPAR